MKKSWTNENYIKKKLLSILKDNCYDFKKLEDLSSLDKIELLMEIEEEFDINIDEDEYKDFNNINDLMLLIEQKLIKRKTNL